jgi:nucleoside-diphosphate-sugar epimerase
MEERLALVTGAGGWLGSRLTEVLTAGLPDSPDIPRQFSRVRALIWDPADRDRLRHLQAGVDIRLGDLRDPAQVAGFCADADGAVLFHCAGVIHPRRVREFYDVNVTGTRHLMAAARKAGVRRAVVASSNSPFGTNARREEVFNEDSPYHPYMNYGRSKMLMEEAVTAASADGALPSVLIRAPWFYGPGQPARQTLFFSMIRDGQVPVVGDGENPRSMSYIDNLCQGFLLAAAAATPAPAYWIADARPYTMNEIVNTVERLLEEEFKTPCAHRRRHLPGLASTVARWVDRAVQGIGLYEQKIHVLSEMNQTIACSVEKARAELGYRPAIDLREGMRRSLQWCFAQGLIK